MMIICSRNALWLITFISGKKDRTPPEILSNQVTDINIYGNKVLGHFQDLHNTALSLSKENMKITGAINKRISSQPIKSTC